MITATIVEAWLQRTAAVLDENKSYLTDLDAAIGDADHGVNIARGFGAVVQKLAAQPGQSLGALFKTAGMTLMSTVGGASGMLYGNFFLKAAGVAGDRHALTDAELLAVLEAGRDGIIQRGRAEPGDKTMIDAWTPALAALRASLEAGQPPAAALDACVAAAEEGMRATIPLQARKGRASYLGERSIGHQDPGATSTYLILRALAETLATASDEM
ncbi:MAG TPA: dihydroxyacetone kinase subunit L [Chloroflexi bacterium]|nr:dihydroxyacetone kinase subunit L [Chloroflexota bacterium]HHW84699.1 dihydroxyacetone kinase subunit L [Chloroflexota bacterium]